jgi:hypothetical protein
VSAASLALEARLAPREWAKACGLCRRTYDLTEWSRLQGVATLPPQSIQAHLTVPAAWTIELRRCACGAVLAARSH